VRPAVHPPSFASPKEGGPRKGDPQSASLRFAAGNLRCWDLGWCRRTRCVLRTPLKQLRQARRRSVCVLRHTRPPQLLRFSAQPAGVGSGYQTAAASQLRLWSVRATRCRRAGRSPWRAERSEGPQAERSNGPHGARSHPLLTVPRSAGPGVSACRRTRASSPGSPKLFDRSCLAEAAQGVLRRHPRTEHHRLPPRPWRGGHGQRVAFLWGTFLWRRKERHLGRRAETRLPPSNQARPNHRPSHSHDAPTALHFNHDTNYIYKTYRLARHCAHSHPDSQSKAAQFG
jgi:hypothetical protein